MDKINDVCEDLSSLYGGKRLRSMTTKFLWIKIKSPIIIYDKNARESLGTKRDDLKGFYEKWLVEFEGSKTKIAEACELLAVGQKNKKFISVIKEVASEPWFHERVFDKFLQRGEKLVKSGGTIPV